MLPHPRVRRHHTIRVIRQVLNPAPGAPGCLLPMRGRPDLRTSTQHRGSTALRPTRSDYTIRVMTAHPPLGDAAQMPQSHRYATRPRQQLRPVLHRLRGTRPSARSLRDAGIAELALSIRPAEQSCRFPEALVRRHHGLIGGGIPSASSRIASGASMRIRCLRGQRRGRAQSTCDPRKKARECWPTGSLLAPRSASARPSKSRVTHAPSGGP